MTTTHAQPSLCSRMLGRLRKRPPAAQCPFLRALTAQDRRAIHSLPADGWTEHALFEPALMGALDIAPTQADLRADAGLLLAMIADRAIATGHWADYAHALAEALRKGHIGVIPWAVRERLPVFGCLPVREQMTTVYGAGTDEASFRLASFLAKATTAHEGLRFRRMLPLAGAHSSHALFHPNPAFIQACLALPAL